MEGDKADDARKKISRAVAKAIRIANQRGTTKEPESAQLAAEAE